MTDTLKDLFEQALAGEPARPVVPDEDIARGRARRARQRRQRWSAGVAVAAVAWLGALVAPALVGPDDDQVSAGDSASVPYDELPPFVPELSVRTSLTSGEQPASADPGRLESSHGESGVDGAAGVEPAAMLTAVRDALPATMSLDTGRTSDAPAVRRQRLHFSGERDGVPFTLQVWWQPGAENAMHFRPCSEPVAAFSRTAVWDACSENMDEQNRWRVIGTPDARHRVLVVDGAPAAITVAWETAAGDEPGVDPAAVLSDDEADRIAEAAWGVAVDSGLRLLGAQGGNVQELRSDFDLGAVTASWGNVEAALTRVLGPLTRVRLDQPDPDLLANWMVGPPEPKVVTASYRTARGGTVELAVWATGPIYGALCANLLACDVWPGSRDYFEPLLNAPADARGGTALGDQGQAYLVLDGVDGDAAALHRAAMEAVFAVLPDPS
ncbi:hypothetical protein E1262_28805 [Jiangella aurantiaca]|uniref:Uncharacterized protein n=1 Tax=Jiangella aurantiaca TaxID=2530373 RepID=A0A4R4ZXZ0_9ACTN|nr:hypothetical protein [Jiangella aurantiaca]TDD64238.1 hypothetical protein E1262_28805 [Jiangella aurantiaca]